MKKIIVLCLLGITLSGCGGSSDTSAKQADNEPKEETKQSKYKPSAEYQAELDREALVNKAAARIIKDYKKQLVGTFEASSGSGYGVSLSMTFDEDGNVKMKEKSEKSADGVTNIDYVGTYRLEESMPESVISNGLSSATEKEVKAIKTYDQYLDILKEVNKEDELNSFRIIIEFSEVTGTFKSADLKLARIDDNSTLDNYIEPNNAYYYAVSMSDKQTLTFSDGTYVDNADYNNLAHTNEGQILTEFKRK